MKRYAKKIEIRKELVNWLKDLTGEPSIYTGVPRCEYKIGPFTVERDGVLAADEGADEDIIQMLMEEGIIGEELVEPGQEQAEEITEAEEITDANGATEDGETTGAAEATEDEETAEDGEIAEAEEMIEEEEISLAEEAEEGDEFILLEDTDSPREALEDEEAPEDGETPEDGEEADVAIETESEEIEGAFEKELEELGRAIDRELEGDAGLEELEPEGEVEPEVESESEAEGEPEAEAEEEAEAEPEAVTESEAEAGNQSSSKFTVSFSMGRQSGNSIHKLLNLLYSQGPLLFKATGGNFSVSKALVEAMNDEEMPMDTGRFLERLHALEEANGSIQGMDFDGDKVSFTGFPGTDDPDKEDAFRKVAFAMNRQSLEQKRIQAKEIVTESEKYTFRNWLVRIGMGGADCKQARNILLADLSGHTAFRNKAEEEKWKARQKEKRELAKAAMADEQEAQTGSSDVPVKAPSDLAENMEEEAVSGM